jgi:hypothetical protein
MNRTPLHSRAALALLVLTSTAIAGSFDAFGLVADAAAQTPDDPNTKAARARFNEGVDNYDRGLFEQARASFLQAYALKRHPAVLLNLALSCAKSKHPAEASRYFNQFLRDSTNLSAEKKAEAEKGLAEARQKVGRVEIVAPAGAEIQIDRERIGTAPLSDPWDLDPGTYVVRVGTFEQRVTASAGQRVTVRVGAEPSKPPEPDHVAEQAKPPEPPAPAESDTGKVSDARITPPAPEAAKKKGLLSPPDQLAPVAIGVGVGVVGLGLTIAFAVAKGSAQTKADDVAAKLRAAGAKPGECTSPPSNYAPACAVLKDNLSAVDTDATIANISAVVAVLGFVGAGVYYLVGPKTDTSDPIAKAARSRGLRLQWAPVVAPKFGGGVLTGSF